MLNFDQILSLGEKQRINFARIFFHTPSLVFLDEVTSAIDIAMEEMLYRRLKNMTLPCKRIIYENKDFVEGGDIREEVVNSRDSKERIEENDKQTCTSRVTIVSVGHRDSLISLHDQVITL